MNMLRRLLCGSCTAETLRDQLAAMQERVQLANRGMSDAQSQSLRLFDRNRTLEQCVRVLESSVQHERDLRLQCEERIDTMAADVDALLRLARVARAVEVQIEAAEGLPECKAAAALLREHVDAVRGMLRVEDVEQ